MSAVAVVQCGNLDGGRIPCDKPEGHSGDRHGHNTPGIGSAAWGYVPADDQK